MSIKYLDIIFNILNGSDEVKRPEFAGGVVSQDGICGGQWRYPRNCSPENNTCEYAIQWIYKDKTVIFLIFPWCILL